MHRDSCRQYRFFISILCIFRRIFLNYFKTESWVSYRKRELFKLPTELSDDSYITVCTCYADYCNGRSSAATTERRIFRYFFLVLLSSLIVLFPIQRISLSSIWCCPFSVSVSLYIVSHTSVIILLWIVWHLNFRTGLVARLSQDKIILL